MPYFQRKPIEGLIDTARSQIPMPGLPSRGPALPGAMAVPARLVDLPAMGTGIVEQARAILASERPSTSPPLDLRSDTGLVGPAQSTQVSQLQAQVNALIEQFVTLVTRPAGLGVAAAPSTSYPDQQPYSDAAGVTVEPAPVLAPPGPVAPGGTAQITIPLANEDDQPARIVFFSTGLIGEDGTQIPAERVSCQPRELMLQPGESGEVIARVVIPQQTKCGIYSGLLRASSLDYLHAVLVVHVEKP
jgi:hypothetical protein